MPYSGEPDYLLTESSKLIISLESVIDAPYMLGENRQYNINNGNIFELILRGLQGSESQGILTVSNTRLLGFPDLEIMNSSLNPAAINQASTYYTRYPSLKKMVNGTLYAGFYKGTQINLPLLENISGGMIVSGCNTVSNINLPLLETISSNTNIIINCPLLTQVSAPLLESVSGGSCLMTGIPTVTEIELPNLKSVLTSGRFLQNLSSLKKFYAPKLIEIRNSAYNMFDGSCNVLDDITFGEGCVHNQTSTILPSNSTAKKVSIKGLAQFANGGVLANNSILTHADLPDLQIISNGTVFNSCSALNDVSLPKLATIKGGTLFYTCNALTEVELPNLESTTIGTIFNNCTAITEVSLPNLKSWINSVLSISCTSLSKIEFPNLERYFHGDANASIVRNGLSVSHLSFPKLKYASSNGNAGFISISGTQQNEITIDLPLLQDTRAMNIEGSTSPNESALSILQGTNFSKNVTVNLGAPQDGYISITPNGSSTKITNLTIKQGFRSYLNISGCISLSKEVLEAIITNLGDNSDYEPLQIVFGASNLAKISDEKKLEATNKNYTLS